MPGLRPRKWSHGGTKQELLCYAFGTISWGGGGNMSCSASSLLGCRTSGTDHQKKEPTAEHRSAPGELLPAACPAASSGSGRSDLRLGPHFYGHVMQTLARVKMHEKHISKGNHNSTPAERNKFQGIQLSLMTKCGRLLFGTNWCC